ncbi:MAG: hypothetical protein P4L86_09380, partial [Mycobacterium sp.]|nr:hypothetical protein [Mycobacterium sp.]
MIRALAVGITAIGLAAACSSTSDSGTKGSSATTAGTASTASSAAPVSAAQLQALVPAPAGAEQTYGPDPISSNGIHL